MNEISTEIKRKIKAYLSGNLSRQDENSLFDWVNQSPDNFSKFQSFVRENEFSLNSTNETDVAWQRFQANVSRKEKSLKRKSISKWVGIAAMVAIVVLAGYYGRNSWSPNQNAIKLKELVVANGKRSEISLTDGTKIWLNSGTTLRYPEKVVGNLRIVELDVEGFLEVSKDPQHPFIIHTPDFDVKVLGTSFNLSSYKEDQMNSLALREGSVEINSNLSKENIRLIPGDLIVLDKKNNVFSKSQADLQNIGSWMNNTLEFSNTNLLDICKSLERQFNVKIEIKSEKLKQIKFSGRFKSDEGLDQLLELLKMTSPENINYKHIQREKEELVILE